MRDALMHFDEWARGQGKGPQKKDVAAGQALRDVASTYWGFEYNPDKNSITLGPYTIDVDTAIQAAKLLTDDIYQAARAVDRWNAVKLRIQTVDAIAAGGMSCDLPDDVLKVSSGQDTKIWLSLAGAASEPDSGTVVEAVIAALAAANLRLISQREPQSTNFAERMHAGEALFVAAVDQ